MKCGEGDPVGALQPSEGNGSAARASCSNSLVRRSHMCVAHQHCVTLLMRLLPGTAWTHMSGSNTNTWLIAQVGPFSFPYIVIMNIIFVAADTFSPPVYLRSSWLTKWNDNPRDNPVLLLRLIIKQKPVLQVRSEAPLSWLTSESWVTINGCWSIPVRANFLLLACLHNLIDSRQDIELRSLGLRWCAKASSTVHSATYEILIWYQFNSTCSHRPT